MKIGIRTSHIYSRYGGGYQAVKWHVLALKTLGHEITVFTTNTPSEDVLNHWFDGVNMRMYNPGVEKDFDGFLNIDHFEFALPLAKQNWAHLFFPHDKMPKPPEGIKLYTNSAYTGRHVSFNWSVPSEVMYIPVDTHFHSGGKSNTILHVSRFAEPTEWADKAQKQIIQAFKLIARSLPDWRLVVAGSVEKGQNFYFAELTRLATGYNIDFQPDQTPKQISDLYAQSSIYWHATGVSLPNIPGAQEHMGITPLEAQASGCVPIVYNSGGMPEVVLNHQTGLLFDNVLDLPGMTLDLIHNMTAWAQLSQAGQIWAQSWQDYDAFVGRVDDMLNDRPIIPMKPLQLTLKYSPSDVTILIPTYNSPLLQQCLDSLKETAPSAKVVIINNGEELSNLTVDHNVQIVKTGENLGFSGALRQMESEIQTPMVLLLNDDVVANNAGWLEQMLHLMNSENVGFVGAKLLFPDGRLQHAGGALDMNRSDIGFHRFYGQPDGVAASTPTEVDFCTGACLLIRKELFHVPDELIGYLDYEELWMSMAAREKGFKTIYQPAAVLTHYEGQTKQRTPEVQEKIEHNKREFIKRWAK